MAEELRTIFQDFLVAPHWYPVVPLVGFILIAAASVGLSSADYADGTESSSPAAWPAPAAISLALLGIICALGKYSDGALPLFAYTILAVLTSLVAANRGIIRIWVADGGPLSCIIRDVLVMVLAIIATVLTLELSWNTKFPALDPLALAIEIGLVSGIMLTLFFIGQRGGALVWIAVVLAGFAGICQYFLARFKGVAILPSDLLAMPTALKVKEGYAFVLDGRGLWGPAAGCVAFALLSLLGWLPNDPQIIEVPQRGRHTAHLMGEYDNERRGRDTLRKVLSVLLNLALGLAVGAATCFAVIKPNYIHDFGVKLDYSDTLESYRTDGFLTAFVAALQDIPVTAPEGYTRAKAAQLQVDIDARYEEELGSSERRAAAIEQFDQDHPSIIVVMNESFADLSVYNGLNCGYEGPTYFKSISNAASTGDLATSVIGGGTCNTEFEFLTGNSYGFIGAGKYPYVMYQMRGENLASQLSSLGYVTHAIHPNDPTNWNRAEVYEKMGFEEFHDISQFEEAPELHMGVTDAATYDKILEILSVDPNPQFIFDVTMQNHGSYNLGNIPEELQVNYQPEGLAIEDDGEESVSGDSKTEAETAASAAAAVNAEVQGITQEDIDALNEYLACIQASDKDLEAFMGELSKLDRKVVLVFFGDHQPPFTPLYNNLIFADEEDAVAHQERVYQTKYVIWANYDIAGTDQSSAVDNASADMLGAMTLDLIGAPLTDYQRARLVIRQEVPALNAFGYLGIDGVWYATDDESSPYLQAYQDLAYLNHLNFGSKTM